MTTVQITLNLADHGDQTWQDVLDVIEHCTPINRGLHVRDGLSGAIDTHSGGFHVAIDVVP